LDLAVTGHVEAESSQDPAQPPLQLSQSPPISCSSRRQISDEVQTDQTEMHNFNSNFFFRIQLTNFQSQLNKRRYAYLY